MKYLILVFFFTCSLTNVFAQDTIVTYLDSVWKQTDIDNYSYIRKTFEKDGVWVVKITYKNGQLQMEGQYDSKNLIYKTGKFVYYHENGKIKSESNYRYNVMIGEYKTYNNSGTIICKEEYSDYGKLLKREKYNDLGIKDGLYEGWWENGKKNVEGFYKDGKKYGEWTHYYSNGELSYKKTYTQDTIELTELTNSEDILTKPEFPGGDRALIEFLGKNVRYPEEAFEKDIDGIVTIAFTIDDTGEVINESVLISVDPLLDAEALRVVKLMPRWTPAKMNNQPIPVFYTVPIKFFLFGDH